MYFEIGAEAASHQKKTTSTKMRTSQLLEAINIFILHNASRSHKIHIQSYWKIIANSESEKLLICHQIMAKIIKTISPAHEMAKPSIIQSKLVLGQWGWILSDECPNVDLALFDHVSHTNKFPLRQI